MEYNYKACLRFVAGKRLSLAVILMRNSSQFGEMPTKFCQI